jgi:hypothetical protein
MADEKSNMVLAAKHRKQIDEIFAAPDDMVLYMPICNSFSSPPPPNSLTPSDLDRSPPFKTRFTILTVLVLVRAINNE